MMKKLMIPTLVMPLSQMCSVVSPPWLDYLVQYGVASGGAAGVGNNTHPYLRIIALETRSIATMQYNCDAGFLDRLFAAT